MVENQHGLGSILSFSAKSVNPKILEALLIGRKKIVDQLENRVKNIAKDGLNHQVLIIGARGTGKTHLLSVLHYRLQTFISQKKIKVAYFAEEEYGIAGYLDFMVRILNAFIRWNEEDADFLKNQLSILQETPPQHQEETIKRIIREYIGGKPLLILAENFNDILDALKKEGQSKLRNWLQENNRISIIATSQALSDDIGKEDKPFYGFFDEITLKPLTLDESFQLLKSLAEIENKTEVIEHLENKGKAQVKAINSLVKGNHRLLITFYEFLKSDILSNLSVMFIKTLNDLKPYYETYIRYLPPQQQKILRFIALSKTPQMGTEIARECFIDQKSLSKQLSELNRKKLIEIILDTDDKRNKLYDIAEPLLRISIEIGEQKEGISALFIDFLALYYDQNELNNQKERFSDIYKECLDPKERQKYSFEILARERALIIQNKLKSNQEISLKSKYDDILIYLQKKEFVKVDLILQSISIQNHDDIYFYTKSMTYLCSKDYVNAKKEILKAIEINSKENHHWSLLGDICSYLNQFDESIEAYEKAIFLNPNKISDLFSLSKSYFKVNKLDESLNILENVISKDPNNEQALLELSSFYVEKDELEESIKILNKIIFNNPNNGEAHYELGNILHQQKKYEKSISAYKKAIVLNPKEELYWISLGLSYGFLKRFDETINSVKEALKINPSSLISFKLISTAYIKLEQWEKATPMLYNIIFNESYGLKAEDVSQTIVEILKYDKNLSLENCLKIENLIVDKFNNHNDLKISLKFIQVYRKVILENNKRALYQLPKEQREFFQKEIVEFREQQKS